MRVIRTEQIWIKTNKKLSHYCHLSKNLYNEGNYLIRQEFFNHSKWIQYNSLYHLTKTSDNYHQLPAQTAQQVLKVLDRNWKSFFERLKSGRRIIQNLTGDQNLLNTNPRMGSLYLFLPTNK